MFNRKPDFTDATEGEMLIHINKFIGRLKMYVNFLQIMSGTGMPLPGEGIEHWKEELKYWESRVPFYQKLIEDGNNAQSSA